MLCLHSFPNNNNFVYLVSLVFFGPYLLICPRVPSVRAVLVPVHRVRPAASVRVHPHHAALHRAGDAHPVAGAAQLGRQPAHLLHVLAAHLH